MSPIHSNRPHVGDSQSSPCGRQYECDSTTTPDHPPVIYGETEGGKMSANKTGTAFGACFPPPAQARKSVRQFSPVLCFTSLKCSLTTEYADRRTAMPRHPRPTSPLRNRRLPLSEASGRGPGGGVGLPKRHAHVRKKFSVGHPCPAKIGHASAPSCAIAGDAPVPQRQAWQKARHDSRTSFRVRTQFAGTEGVIQISGNCLFMRPAFASKMMDCAWRSLHLPRFRPRDRPARHLPDQQNQKSTKISCANSLTSNRIRIKFVDWVVRYGRACVPGGGNETELRTPCIMS